MSKTSKWYNSRVNECKSNTCYSCGVKTECNNLKRDIVDFPQRYYKELTSVEKQILILRRSRKNVGEVEK